jgi:DNA-binding LacI/PurR family transcriptional regulator
VVEREGSPLRLEFQSPETHSGETIGSVLSRLDVSQGSIREEYLRKYLEDVHVEFRRLPQEHRYILELSLLPEFVKPPEQTCILALNDHMAHAYCRRWELLGGSPSNIRQLVSFDDCLDVLFPYQVSSVNFGFDLLGYKAFHFLLDDIPIDVGRYRSIDAVPRLSHRHTIRPVRC